MMHAIWLQIQKQRQLDVYGTAMDIVVTPRDEEHFTKLLRFMLEFNRCSFLHKHHQARTTLSAVPVFEVSRISLLLDEDLLQYIVDACNRAEFNKKWAQLAPLVGSLKELFMSLEIMFHSDDSNYRLKTTQLLMHLLYEKQNTDQLVSLMRNYEPNRNSRRYLCELAELIHVLLRLIQSRSRSKVGVNVKLMTKKKKQRRRKKPAATASSEQQADGQAVPDSGFMVGEEDSSDAINDEEDWDGQLDEEDEEDEAI
jgi:hypothetical protein